jgi:hypothetical protein
MFFILFGIQVSPIAERQDVDQEELRMTPGARHPKYPTLELFSTPKIGIEDD